jgi:hypothetical protein
MITRGREIDVTVKVMPDGGRKDAFGTLGFRKVTKKSGLQNADRETA